MLPHMNRFLTFTFAIFLGLHCFLQARDSSQPNILWLSTEDIGPHLGCYGDDLAHTPRLDALASEGIRFTHAYTVAGVCAANRSCIITGVYQTTLGTQHMRAGGEGTERSIMPRKPDNIHCFSKYLRQAGYYCTNNSKEDYNFVPSRDAWDESSVSAHWRNRKNPDQPFFAVFNYSNTHEGSVRSTGDAYNRRIHRLKPSQRQVVSENIPPPFHPNTPTVRENWAKYRELITGLDYWIGDHLDALEEEGLSENTIVFFWSDHGAGLPRSKRWLYDSGTHVPLIVYIPEKYRHLAPHLPGKADNRLVSSIDFAPTVLALCSLHVPQYMQGRDFLSLQKGEPRGYVFGARDRMDDRYDIIRMVRNHRYKYIRNYEPYKPYDQYMNTAERSPVKQELRRLASKDALDPGQHWVVAHQKPVEELYDTLHDPHELINLANSPQHHLILVEMRTIHEEWMIQTSDTGLIPESELVRMESIYGSRYEIAPSIEEEHPGFLKKLRNIAIVAGKPSNKNIQQMIKGLQEKSPSMRYWACIGLGEFEAADRSVLDLLFRHLNDASPIVRIIAARALFKHEVGQNEALDVLREAAQSDLEWVRLKAVIVLDEIGEKARPAIPELQKARQDTHNKYVVRVANRALNQLLVQDRQVR